MDYLEHMKQRLSGGEPYVPAWLGRKDEVRQFARYVGIELPEKFFEGPIDKLPTALPGRFALKPNFASTSIGVLLLENAGAERFDNLVSGERVHREEIVNACRTVAKKYFSEENLAHATFVVEELLEGLDGASPPADVRCYAFQGEIGMILMEHHISGPANAMYFDHNFQPFEDLEERYGVHPAVDHLERIVPALPPSNASDILQVARRISTAIPSAFCRIDLYNTPRGIILGELTFFPGTFYYKNRKIMHEMESARLGRMWDAALERMKGSRMQTTPKSAIRL